MALRTDDQSWQRMAAATGIGFVVLAFIAFLLDPTPPMPGDPNDEIRSHFADNSTRILWQGFLFGLATILFLWFIGTLAAYLRREERDPAGRLPAIVVASGATASALFLAGAAVSTALANRADELGAETAGGLYALGNTLTSFTGIPGVAFGAAVALGILRTRALDDWVAWAGLVVAALLLLDALLRLFADEGFFAQGGWFGIVAFLAFLVWVLATSALLTQRVARGRTETRAATA